MIYQAAWFIYVRMRLVSIINYTLWCMLRSQAASFFDISATSVACNYNNTFFCAINAHKYQVLFALRMYRDSMPCPSAGT